MTLKNHRKLCYFAIAFWIVSGAIAGVCIHGWTGVMWAIPGLILGAILHKLFMENLPIRCPKCGNKIRVSSFHWLGADRAPQGTFEPTYYRCQHCGFEEDAGF